MEMSEYKQLFLSEAQEILNALNSALVDLEKGPGNTALLNEVFRRSHTLKSMAQSMGYEDIAGLTHSMESALAALKTGRLKANKGTVDVLFKCLDVLENLVKGIGRGKTKKVGIQALVKRLEEIAASPGQETKPRREKQSEESLAPHRSAEAGAVRVPLTRLDDLMDAVGELATNRIRLADIAQGIRDKTLEEAVTQMSRLTSQLQSQAMQMRLVPLEYILAPYPRLIRDMAAEQKKEVDLILEGSDIGLDRAIQDEINEPLLHLLKNAVTHGIEKPNERERLKKPRRGKIKILARREQNHVVIELSDDGKGIDIEEVREVALRRGIITEEELSALSPTEILMLITSPGYSGVDKVTEAAGRGVGMNAVRSKVESFGGVLDIDVISNKRTTFSIRLPLTMSISQLL